MLVQNDTDLDFIPPEFDNEPGVFSHADLARLANEGEYVLPLEQGKADYEVDPKNLERLKPVTRKLRRRVLSVLKYRMPKGTKVIVHDSWDFNGPPNMIRLYGPRGGNRRTMRG